MNAARSFFFRPLLVGFIGSLATVLAAAHVQAQVVHTWNGTSDSNFQNAANWTGGVPPFNNAPGVANIRISVQNGANNPLIYSALEGNTIYDTNGGATFGRSLVIGSGVNGSMTISGGTFDSRGVSPDFMANAAVGSLTMSGGNYIKTGAGSNVFIVVFGGGGTGTLNLNGGTFSVGTLQYGDAAGSTGTGTVHLNAGGTLEAVSIVDSGSATSNFNFNGGTLRALAGSTTLMGALNNSQILGGGAVVDTNGETTSIASNLLNGGGGGGLTKNGTGTLTLSGAASTYTGLTQVNDGVLQVNSSAALGTTAGATNVASAGRLDLPGGVTITGETLNLTGNDGAASLRNIAGSNAWDGPLTATASGSFTRILSDAGTLTLSGAVTISSGSLVLQGDGNGAISGNISGGGLIKSASGTGTWTLSGTNTYTTTTISNGTLQIGNGGATGTLGSGAVTNNAALVFNRSDAAYVATNDIGGTGTVTQNGSGTVTLSGNNSYSGLTTVATGILQVNSNTALGTTAGATTVNSTAALILGNGVTVTGETLNLSGTAGNLGALRVNAGESATWNGTVNLDDASSRIGAGAGGTLTVSGVIQNGAAGNSLFFSGASGTGTAIISGTSNTYTGNTNIVRGVLKIGALNALPIGTTLDIDIANAAEDATFDLNGFNQQVANLQRTNAGGGAGASILTNSSLTNATFTLNNSASNTFGGNLVGSTLTFNKINTGTLNLDGDNSAFSGTFNHNSASSVFFTNTLADSAAANWNLNVSGALLASNAGVGNTFDLGSLSGVTGSTLRSGGLAAGTNTFSIGALNTSTTFAGNILEGSANTTAITKVGTGTLTLTGNNTYAGATNVNAGVLNIQSNTALGTTAGSTTVANGAALQLQNGITVTGEALSIIGGGISNTGALRNISGSNTWTGAISMAAGAQSRIHSDSGNLLLTGGINSLGNNTLVLAGAGNGEESGTISNVFQLTKEGGGTWILSGNNTYNTATNISNGTLQIGNGGTAGTLGNGTGVVNNNAALVFNRSDAAYVATNNIGGTGTVTQIGSGTTTLSGTNTYSGLTTVANGTLQLGSDTALPTGAVVVIGVNDSNNATLNLSAFDATVSSITFALGTGGNKTLSATTGSALVVTGGVVNNTGAATANFDMLGGTATVGSGFATDNLNVGRESNTGSLTLSGGAVNIGSGPSNFINIGVRDPGTSATLTKGTADFSAASSLNINVGTLQLGVNTSAMSVAGTTEGDLILPLLGAKGINSPNLLIGHSNGPNNSGVTSTLTFGGGLNTVTTDNITVGGAKSTGNIVLPASATLALSGSTGAAANLMIGDNTPASGATGVTSTGTFDTSPGILNATLAQVTIGRHGSGAGAGVGTMTMGQGTVTATGVMLADPSFSGVSSSPANTTGTLNMVHNAGSFTVNGNVTDGGGVSTLNVEGGTFTVNGGLTVDHFRAGMNQLNGTVNVNGGAVNIGNGTEGMYVGRRLVNGSTATVGVADFSAASAVNINVADLRLGNIANMLTGTGTAQGTLTLSSAGPNTINAAFLLIGNVEGDMTPDNTGPLSSLNLGGGTNTINVSGGAMRVGGPKSRGELVLAPGGTLNLTLTASELRVGGNDVGNTGTNGVGTFDTSAGTINLNAGIIRIGLHSEGSGSGVGTMNLGDGMATAAAIVLADAHSAFPGISTNPLNTQGTLNLGAAFDSLTVGATTFVVGRDGVGLVNQDGGSVTSNTSLIIGQNQNPGAVNSQGTYDISAGSLTVAPAASDLIVGSAGTGTLNVSGSATVTTPDLLVGNTSTGIGTVNQSGGTLNVTNPTTYSVGAGGGMATVNHTGGTTNVTGNMLIGDNSGPVAENNYNLNGVGSVLDFGDTLTLAPGAHHQTNLTPSTLDIRSDGQFNFNSGTLLDVSTVNANNSASGSTPAGTFHQNGTTALWEIGQQDTGPAGLTTLNGNLLQSSGTIAFDVFGYDVNNTPWDTMDDMSNNPIDLLIVNGDAQLGGTVDVDFFTVLPPVFGDVFPLMKITGEVTIDPTFHIDGGFFRVVPDGMGNFTLQAIVPEPGTVAMWSLLALAAGGFAVRMRGRRRE